MSRDVSFTDTALKQRGQDNPEKLSNEEIQKMIKYLNQNTQYKVVTDTEFDLIRHSTPREVVKRDPGQTSGKSPPPTPVRKYTLVPLQKDDTVSAASNSNWQRPRLPTFSGEEKSETTFDVWKYEVKCLIREKNFEDTVLIQSMRNSLKGSARNLLLTIPEVSSPDQVLEKLEGVYGNVYSSEALLQQFYTERQMPNQSVANYGMKLQSILHSAIDKGQLFTLQKDDMLRSKFWSGLHDPLLKNVSRHKYDSAESFDELLRDVRAIELDLSNSSRNENIASSGKGVQHSSMSTDSKSISDLVKKIDQIGTRMESIETELKNLKEQNSVPQNAYGNHNRGNAQGYGHRGGYKNNRGRGSSNRRGSFNQQSQVQGQQNSKPSLNG